MGVPPMPGACSVGNLCKQAAFNYSRRSHGRDARVTNEVLKQLRSAMHTVARIVLPGSRDELPPPDYTLRIMTQTLRPKRVSESAIHDQTAIVFPNDLNT